MIVTNLDLIVASSDLSADLRKWPYCVHCIVVMVHVVKGRQYCVYTVYIWCLNHRDEVNGVWDQFSI